MDDPEAFLLSVRHLLENRGILWLRQVQWPQHSLEPYLWFEGFLPSNQHLHRFEKTPTLRWRVECGEVYEFRIQSQEISSLEMPSHHPAMRELYVHNKSLHFTGKPNDLPSLVVELLTLNESLMQGRVPLTAYLRCWGIQSLVSLLESGFGVVAVGPEELLHQYASLLERYGCNTSLFGPAPSPLAGEGDEYLGYHMLLWNSTCYVIAEEFRFVREV